MMSALDTALAGLTAFAKKLDVSAHNVANVNTDEFKKSRAEFLEVEPGACSPSSKRMIRPGRRS